MHGGARLGDIGEAVQRYAESHRCAVVREYCGHGIGRSFHEAPQVLHYGRPGEGVALATTQTVITTAIAVLLVDFIVSALML